MSFSSLVDWGFRTLSGGWKHSRLLQPTGLGRLYYSIPNGTRWSSFLLCLSKVKTKVTKDFRLHSRDHVFTWITGKINIDVYVILDFIDQTALARRLRRDLSGFESSCHLLTYLLTTHGEGFTLSILILNVKKGSSKMWILILSLCFDPTGNWTRFFCFSRGRSNNSTTDRLRGLNSRFMDQSVNFWSSEQSH